MSARPPRRREGEEPLVRIAAKRAVRRMREDAATPEFGRMLSYQAFGAAGDALVALALAGSLFFSVPESTARGRVALYLVLTMAPFAIVAPLLSAWLDRHRGSMRIAMLVASLGRAVCAFLLTDQLNTLLLFPLAFAILVLSRATIVVRGAVLPQLIPEGRSLVDANASLSRAGALAGIAAGLPGLAILKWLGSDQELFFAALVYVCGVVPAFRLPAARGRRALEERIGARTEARSVSIRQAIVGAAGMRFLVGFLVFHLAFALRREDFTSVGLGLLVGSAALGGLVGALIAPRLRRRLKEEGILVASMFVAGVSGVLVGRFFTVVNAGILVFAFGVASGAAKVAFDSIIQRETPEGARGWAFARSEAYLQLAWVAGAFVPLLPSIPSGPGVFGAGVAANLLAILYVFGRLRVRSTTMP